MIYNAIYSLINLFTDFFTNRNLTLVTLYLRRVKSSIDETDSEKAYRNYQEDDDDRHDDGALGCAGRIDGEWDDDDEEEFNSDADNNTHRNQQMHASQLHHMQQQHQQQQQHSYQSHHHNQSLKIHTTYTTHTDGSHQHQQQHHHQLLQQQQQQHDSHPSPTHRPSQHRTNNLKGASIGNAGSQFQNDFDAGIVHLHTNTLTHQHTDTLTHQHTKTRTHTQTNTLTHVHTHQIALHTLS
jgi:hypothetical protein